MIEKHWLKALGVLILLAWGALLLVKRVIFDEITLRYVSLVIIGILAAIGTERLKNGRNLLDFSVSVVSFVLAFSIARDLIVN
ncbi:TPA: hypothetical protein DHW62_00285 [candidate division WWE3 bacterium]|uniref:Uncharacterized protein n=1 Tax=candidate division WWE3 bacterium TaxID=2053526 RepID=A0A656PPB8_UNCKA|nr:hypothetical protein P147_WWE3C00001G0211 [candidate division WWE3 bacterium RAAC2_WWE3_1]KKS29886.1 MAG: hypothetical protein UU91_C0003G0044 [candidate division WWE3 bacterium GW2011_GWB1_42_117]KKS55311.1 MAG: hypothetical protein UV21_C0002G0185 [candidate division WWE3 bacterium GW2011_GWD2_42_34]KKT05864.1 MAG: hypothetical protein UV83_C0001G0182 [candidate division WWE3 bacterium GW2011_GWE2_43_18]KKT07246.1 MAG: hypothetical protein UV84_C0001G0082 [candidate division WWE3 bacterium